MKNTRKSCTIGKVFGQILWLDKFIDKNERGATVEFLNDPLAYIVAGVKEPLRQSLTGALLGYLEAPSETGIDELMKTLHAAAQLLIPLPDYDISDFRSTEIIMSLSHLSCKSTGEWAQLLYALNLGEQSVHYARLKALSPFPDGPALFFLVEGDGSQVRMVLEQGAMAPADMQGSLPLTNRPGNAYMLELSEFVIGNATLIPITDFPPATA